MQNSRSLYEILGLEPGATVTDIRKKYHRLSKQHHPDKNIGGSNDMFLNLQYAYEQLTRPIIKKKIRLTLYEAYHGVQKDIKVTVNNQQNTCTVQFDVGVTDGECITFEHDKFLLTVNVTVNPEWERIVHRGNGLLYYQHYLTLSEVLHGFKVSIPHMQGSFVIQHGKPNRIPFQVTLNNYGMMIHDGTFGNMVVDFGLLVPEDVPQSLSQAPNNVNDALPIVTNVLVQ